MKRSFSFLQGAEGAAFASAGLALIAATYGLVRLAYGLLLPDVRRDLDIATPTAGAIAAGASITYCVGAVAGFALAPIRPRALVAVAGVGASIGALGMALAGDGATFAVAAVAASSGAGLASPALVAMLATDRVARERPQLQSVVNAGTGPGLVIAALLALSAEDWRTVWLVASVTAAVAAIATIVSHRAASGVDARAATPRPSRAWLRTHAPVVAAALLMGVASAATWSFGRTIVVDAGASDDASILAWVALGLGGTAAVATAGPLERLGPRRAWTITVLVLAAATATLAIAPGAVVAAGAACAAFGWGYTAGSGALIAWTRALDASRAASGTAMLFVTLVLGQAAGAALVGATAPVVGLGAAFAAAAGIACLAILAVSTGWARERQRADSTA